MDTLNLRFLSEFHKKLSSHRSFDGNKIQGCNQLEILKIIEGQEKSLDSIPESYKEFLRNFGINVGIEVQFSRAYMIYPYSLELYENIKELLDEGNIAPSKLLDLNNTFVFYAWEAYEFYFFYVNPTIDNPFVFGYDDLGNINETGLQFSQFICTLIPNYEPLT
jgi:hypothetical protein